MSCAAIIDEHTTEVIAKEKKVVKKVDNNIEKKVKKMYEDDVMKNSVLEMIEMEIQEKLAAALECSGLLLSIGEHLFFSLISKSASSSFLSTPLVPLSASNRDGFGSNIDTTQCILRSASLHFISSIMGTFHTDNTSDRNTHNNNIRINDENQFNSKKEKVKEMSRSSLICNVAEICSLRQHFNRRNPHERLNGNSSKSNDTGVLSENVDGNRSWDDGKTRNKTRLGLLQSCLEYAQYVRTSTVKLQGELFDEKIGTEQTTTQTTGTPASKSRNDPIQFAALHHLAARINQFIAIIIQEKSVFDISHMSSKRSELSSKIDSNNCFLSWVLLEEYFSWERLLSNSISYISVQLREENTSLCSLLRSICTAKQTRMDFTSTLIKTSPPVVAQGLYAWQSHRVLQLLMLNDLQLLNEGFKVNVVDRPSVIAGVLKCMHSMGQGMKGKVVQMAQVVITDVFSKINGVSCLIDNGGQSKIIENKVPFAESAIKKETNDQNSFENEKIMGLKSEILNNLLGIKDAFNTRLNYSDFAVILESEKKIQEIGNITDKHSPVSRSLCDWKNDYHDAKLPVKCSWPLDCLETFSGEQFERWLVILATHESQPYLVEIMIQSLIKNKPSSLLSISPAVSNIHKLLKLACPEEGHRWVTLKEVAPVVDEGEEYETLMVIDASPAAVQAYCSLLEVCSSHIVDERNRIPKIDNENNHTLNASNKVNPSKISHIEQLISVSQGALSSSNGLLRRGGGLGAGGTEESVFGFGTRAELGVMELCGKLLEGITSQHISSGNFVLFSMCRVKNDSFL